MREKRGEKGERENKGGGKRRGNRGIGRGRGKGKGRIRRKERESTVDEGGLGGALLFPYKIVTSEVLS